MSGHIAIDLRDAVPADRCCISVRNHKVRCHGIVPGAIPASAASKPHWRANGFAPNRHALESFLRYHYEQGLSKRMLAPEELFAPEALESFKI